MPPIWEGSGEAGGHGRKVGRIGDQGNGGGGGRMEGVLEPWQPKQCDWAGLSLGGPGRGTWKKLVRGAV